MEIPKIRSAPSDPLAPSFLTLPAEVRNSISEYVFVLPEPIHIHNTDFYYDRKSYEPYKIFPDDSSEDDRDMDWGPRTRHFANSMEEWEERHYYLEREARIFRNKAALGLGLLKSCRQIYHETVNFLYSDNTFIVSSVGSRCDREEIKRCRVTDRNDYYQIKYAPMWLASLGSDEVDEKVWNGDLVRCSITFARYSRLTNKCSGSSHPSNEEEDIDENAARLNKAFVALERDETLDLRRLSNSELLLSSVSIYNYGETGQVQYYSGPRSVCRSFTVDQASGEVRWATAGPVGLLELPRKAQGMVCAYVITEEESLRLFRDYARIPNFDRSIFDVSMRLRPSLVKAVGEYMPVVIELATKERVDDDCDAHPLRRFDPRIDLGDDDSLASKIANASLGVHSGPARPTILIQVVLTRPTNPTHIHININQLVNFIQTPYDKILKDDIRVGVEVQQTGNDNSRCETSYTTIAELKMKMFLYFTDVLDQLPRNGTHGPARPEL
ncbi:hypothetical protein BKA58DRAFT_450396 [Alternaria rosae]|uniref:uncharacterized protein n=1 Tax=Alternaria rosae TaxID=1187941 RepID=UPI001E8E4B86|nr:uncharacterized protein BKA58DRAFT_450396 [Alternaria rosae]KAH6853047.1 hypothetical protein BKA58DRAFT_450396 [Alternaria rosae]